MDALAPRQLGKAFQFLCLEPIPYLLRGGDNLLPADAFVGIKIEHDPIAEFQEAQSSATDINFQGAQLRTLDEFTLFFHRDHVVLSGLDDMAKRRVFDIGSYMLLKETFAGNSVRT